VTDAKKKKKAPETAATQEAPPPVSASEEKYYLAAEVEKMLDISKSTLKRLVKAGKIVAVKFGANVQGNPWHFSEKAIEDYKKTKSVRHFNITETK
jgi:hypothetical protein